MMKYYVEVDSEGNVCQQIAQSDEDAPPEANVAGWKVYPSQHVIDWTGPTKFHKLKWINGDARWVDGRALEQLKAHKNAEINAARLAANRSYFVYLGKKVACDELSRSDIDAVNGVVTLLGIVPIAQWKTIDNTYVPISDKAAWIQFYMAMVQQGQQNFDHAQSLKVRLEAAEDAESVAAIVWAEVEGA
jgi:hypothetical protein